MDGDNVGEGSPLTWIGSLRESEGSGKDFSIGDSAYGENGPDSGRLGIPLVNGSDFKIGK